MLLVVGVFWVPFFVSLVSLQIAIILVNLLDRASIYTSSTVYANMWSSAKSVNQLYKEMSWNQCEFQVRRYFRILKNAFVSSLFQL